MNLQQKLAAKRFVLTAEVTPPVSAAREDLIAKAAPLKGLADAVNVTDGAGARPHLGAVTSAAILIQNGIEPIVQFTCRDRNRIGLQSELLSAAAVGARNLLILRGDDPSQGDQPEAKPVFDLDARGLLETARRLRDQGELPTGKKIGGRTDFFLGGADMPIDPKPEWKPDGLKGKIAAGAQFAQTQFCMDVGVARRYTARLAEHGVFENFHLIVGVVPFKSAKSARWIKEKLFGAIIPDAFIERMEKASDPEAEGRRICVEVVQQLSEIPHVSGAHIMAPNNDAAVPDVIRAAREKISRLALV